MWPSSLSNVSKISYNGISRLCQTSEASNYAVLDWLMKHVTPLSRWRSVCRSSNSPVQTVGYPLGHLSGWLAPIGAVATGGHNAQAGCNMSPTGVRFHNKLRKEHVILRLLPSWYCFWILISLRPYTIPTGIVYGPNNSDFVCDCWG